MAEKHPLFWKVKEALVQRELDLARANARVSEVMREAGLDPAKSYTLNDDETITEATP